MDFSAIFQRVFYFKSVLVYRIVVTGGLLRPCFNIADSNNCVINIALPKKPQKLHQIATCRKGKAALRYMLHAFYRLKIWIILVCVNLLCDITVTAIAHSQNSRLNTTELTGILFQKFFCYEVGIIEIAVFFSLFGTILFFCVNALRNDNQKYGLFVLTRVPRLKYTALRICSILLFIISAVFLSSVSAFFVHKIVELQIQLSYYLQVACLYFFSVIVCVFPACLLYSIFKSAPLAYSGGIIAAFLLCTFTAKQSAENDMLPLPWTLAAAVSCLLITIFFILTIKGDFMATKIKE